MTEPDNGIVTHSNQLDNEMYIFGTVATYTCSPGYGLSSTQSRTCTTVNGRETTGRFSGNEPTCDSELMLLATVILLNVHRYHMLCSP